MTGNIFVVEDEMDFIDIYRRIFDTIGLRIIGHARSGEDALERLVKSTKKPDLIIMDHHLPGISGVETTIKILQVDPTATILFVSVDDQVRRSALKCGAVDFICKPFLLDNFISSVTKYCKGTDGRVRTRKAHS